MEVEWYLSFVRDAIGMSVHTLRDVTVRVRTCKHVSTWLGVKRRGPFTRLRMDCYGSRTDPYVIHEFHRRY